MTTMKLCLSDYLLLLRVLTRLRLREPRRNRPSWRQGEGQRDWEQLGIAGWEQCRADGLCAGNVSQREFDEVPFVVLKQVKCAANNR